MSFYFSDTAVLLFDFWSVHTPTGTMGAGGSSWFGDGHGQQLRHPSKPPSLSPLPKPISGRSGMLGEGGDASCPGSDAPIADGVSHLLHRWFRYHIGQTLFHVVQVVLGYMVMLAVMSYNAWIFLGAIAGSTLGYFVVYPLLGRG
ncbi:PREDICTED: LOW QUALITY PROTEIN: probable low affinity copper uptake protein 2 [Pygoscelis adeliae]|uniref:LOW QUALITY PROTEIN: probable low affinity copper uptake protein 2 n=1 Tax=Pygoscelis adeliae TaxID=9238 RepID=UPI0004F4E6DF|nr:PREDICTED: LOW QUALITY PROTEIN: probable low affinity copper uptake protein 2 [Pygoscelis adeliae]